MVCLLITVAVGPSSIPDGVASRRGSGVHLRPVGNYYLASADPADGLAIVRPRGRVSGWTGFQISHGMVWLRPLKRARWSIWGGPGPKVWSESSKPTRVWSGYGPKQDLLADKGEWRFRLASSCKVFPGWLPKVNKFNHFFDYRRWNEEYKLNH